MAQSSLDNTTVIDVVSKTEIDDCNSNEQNIIIDSETTKAAQSEQDSEIACLELIMGDWKLTTGSGYLSHWERAIGPNNELTHEENVFIISVLGNTAAGKSFIAKRFFHEHEKKPTTVSNLHGSTTGNINCFESNQMTEGMKRTLVLDFEGEKGTSNPLMLYARKLREKLSFWSPREMSKRLEAVSDYFPKLAYILSNVVILIGREEIVSTDYLTRCFEFARRANLGVDQVVYRPVLIIIQNQSPLDKAFDIKKVTEEFFSIHRQAENLELFRGCFSQIYCIRLPHIDQLQKINGVTVDGEIIFNRQISALKELFSDIFQEHQKRLITHPQWLFLAKRVLTIVSSGNSVSIHSLLSEVTDTGDANQSLTKNLFLTLYSKKSIHTPEWFKDCRLFALKVLARYLAISFVNRGNIISERLIREKSKQKLLTLWEFLDDFAPCEATRPSTTNLTTEKPIFCYQHRGAHLSHRPSQGSGKWLPLFIGKLFSLAWEGSFQSTEKAKPDKTVVEYFVKTTFDFLKVLKESKLAILETFKQIFEEHKLDLFSVDCSLEIDCICCLHSKDCECRGNLDECQNTLDLKENESNLHCEDSEAERPTLARRSIFVYRNWLKRQMLISYRMSLFPYCERCTRVFKLMAETDDLKTLLTFAPANNSKMKNSISLDSTIQIERSAVNSALICNTTEIKTDQEQLASESNEEKTGRTHIETNQPSSSEIAATSNTASSEDILSVKPEGVSTSVTPLAIIKACKICNSSEDDYCLVPCGHRSFCHKCASVFAFCPICGRKKEMMLKLQDI